MTINTSCEKCGGATRLVGIEPHPRLADTDRLDVRMRKLRQQRDRGASARHGRHDARRQGSRPVSR